jgi:hypothetical protein
VLAAAAVDLVMHVALRLIIDAGRGAVHCRANYKPRPRARAATYSIKSAKVVIGSCSIGRMCIYAELLIGASSGDCTPMHSNANNTRTLACLHSCCGSGHGPHLKSLIHQSHAACSIQLHMHLTGV